MNNPITITVFDPVRDLRRILEIEKDSFGAEAWPAAMFLDYAVQPSVLFLVARLNRTGAGYVIAELTARGTVEIPSIAVHSRYRRKQIASRLFHHVTRHARRHHATSVWLMVRPDNDAALHFYRRLGFVRTATIPHYYEDGSRGWRMRLPLL